MITYRIRSTPSPYTEGFCNSLHQVKGYPKTDCGSDYVPVVATMKVTLGAMRKNKTVIIKLQIDLLRTNNEHITTINIQHDY